MSDRGKISALLLAVAVLAAIIAGLAYKFIVVGSTEKSADGRTAIVLAPAERDLVLAEMRGFVAALQQISAALAKDDMQAVAKAARGIGMAMYIERCGGGTGDTVILKVDPEGGVTLISGMQDNGQGHVTTFVQLLSDKLGIDAERIRVVQGDTDVVPSGLTGGSRFLAIGGVAAMSAGEQMGMVTRSSAPQ